MERSILREYAEAFIIAVIFLRFTQIFILQTFYIPSGSMEKTLLIGDHLFVNRFIYGPAPTGLEKGALPSRDVQRGDIVVFRSPENPNIDVVKRCVAVPGDTVEMRPEQLYINGKAVDDSSYAIYDPTFPASADQKRLRDNYGHYERYTTIYGQEGLRKVGPETVPPDHYFCMGDNRNQSYDSRFWGMLPRHLVKGRALFIYWSNGGPTDDGEWRGFGQKIAQLRRTVTGFFTNTRWERTFRLIR